jgi:hypothetical protein
LTTAEKRQLSEDERERRKDIERLREAAAKVVLLVFKDPSEAQAFVGMQTESRNVVRVSSI